MVSTPKGMPRASGDEITELKRKLSRKDVETLRLENGLHGKNVEIIELRRKLTEYESKYHSLLVTHTEIYFYRNGSMYILTIRF